MNRSPHPPTSIFKVYRKALTGLSHVQCPDGLNNTFLSRQCPWNSSLCGNGGQSICSQDRGAGGEPPSAWVLLIRQSLPLRDLRQQLYKPCLSLSKSQPAGMKRCRYPVDKKNWSRSLLAMALFFRQH